jgi:uncharacterized protein with HEPN domain
LSEPDESLVETIRDAIARIVRYTAGFDERQFLDDQRTIDAVALNLLVIGECSRRLSEPFKLKTTAPWAQIIALRHRIAHGYASVNPVLLWKIATQGVTDLTDEIGERR